MSMRTNTLSSSNPQELAALRRDPSTLINNKPDATVGGPATSSSRQGLTDGEFGVRRGHHDSSLDELQEAVENLNKTVEAIDRALEFDIHEGTNRVMVRVVDRSNDEVIREVPPEKVLDLMAELRELVGFLVDERV